jgi:site-specific recombinase XerD
MATFSEEVQQAISNYCSWLETQPLAANTRRAYATQVGQYGEYLLKRSEDQSGHPLQDAFARDYAARDYKLFLKTVQHLRPTTVNLALAALDHFYLYLGLGKVKVRREELPQLAPRALEIEEQRALLRAMERTGSARDQAMMMLLLYTGLRVGEVAQLDLADVAISARKGMVIVRSGKGDSYREVPLNAPLREALMTWKQTRTEKYPNTSDTAFFLNRQGRRMTTRAIGMVVEKIGKEAGLEISPHVLRHTCLTNLVRNGNDLVLVADIAGHRRLETTRRYSLPSEQDRALAMEKLPIEY